MIYFTSDTHFGDDRLQLFYRDLFFKDVDEMNNYIIDSWNNVVGADDTVFHLGDAVVSEKNEDFELLNRLAGYKVLITGNYDEKITFRLANYFDEIAEHKTIRIKGIDFYLNHYPLKAKENIFNLVGHIHSLWKVQKNMINVSTDCWGFKPISIDTILFCYNSIKNYYDQNVFPNSKI